MEISTRRARNSKEYAKLNAYTVLACAILAVAVVALIFTIWFTAVKIADEGMSPALEKGQVVLCDKLSKFFLAPKRGDMYCYEDTLGASAYIGRIIALPGETVEIYQGKLYINDCLLEESYIAALCPKDAEPMVVEQGAYFILPDDRDNIQSVSVEELVISAKRLVGRIAIKVWPIEKTTLYK